MLAKRMTSNMQDTAAVVKSIRALNRWETASYRLEKIIDSGTKGNIFQEFLFGNKILLITQGEVIGGFNLENFSDKNIKIEDSKINVTLPAPEVLITKIDNSKTRVYDRQKGLLVPSDNNLESEALSSAQKAIMNEACTEGILNKAAENARSELTSILLSFKFTEINITIPSGHCSN